MEMLVKLSSFNTMFTQGLFSVEGLAELYLVTVSYQLQQVQEASSLCHTKDAAFFSGFFLSATVVGVHFRDWDLSVAVVLLFRIYKNYLMLIT